MLLRSVALYYREELPYLMEITLSGRAGSGWTLARAIAEVVRHAFSRSAQRHRVAHRYGVPLGDCIRCTAMKMGTAAKAAAIQNATSAGTDMS